MSKFFDIEIRVLDKETLEPLFDPAVAYTRARQTEKICRRHLKATARQGDPCAQAILRDQDEFKTAARRLPMNMRLF